MKSRKRKKISHTSADSKVVSLITKAFNKSKAKADNLGDSVKFIDARIAWMEEAINLIEGEAEVKKHNITETANECWNILADYFTLNNKDDDDFSLTLWDTDDRLFKLIRMADFCEKTYTELDEVNAKSLKVWKRMIQGKLQREAFLKPMLRDRKPILKSDTSEIKEPAKKIPKKEVLKKAPKKVISKKIPSTKVLKETKQEEAPKSLVAPELSMNEILFPKHDISPVTLPQTTVTSQVSMEEMLLEASKKVVSVEIPMNEVLVETPRQGSLPEAPKKEVLPEAPRQENLSEAPKKEVSAKKKGVLAEIQKKKVKKPFDKPKTRGIVSVDDDLNLSMKKIIFSKNMEFWQINGIMIALSRLPKTKIKKLQPEIFKFYKYLLKQKYNNHPFKGDYKNILTTLQGLAVGEIPEEKQLGVFNQLVAEIKAKEPKLEDRKEEKVDVNITLPTEAMLLHPSHTDYPDRKDCVNGDASRRLLHGLKGVKSVIDRGALNFKLITVTDPESAEKFMWQEDKKNEIQKSKNINDVPLSLALLHTISKEFEMSLTADVDGDILVNDKTLQAILDSTELARKAVQQSKENKAPSITILRPPGHHSGIKDIQQLNDIRKAEGFCFINNVFVGAETAASLNAKNILIIDFDTHDGNGTKKLLSETWDHNSNIYFVNTYSQNLYPYQEATPKACPEEIMTKTHNTIVKIFDRPFPKKPVPVGDKEVMQVIESCLTELKSKNIDTVLVSCGVDAHKDDPLGQGSGKGIALSDDFYKNIIVKIQQYFPEATLSIFLEGGYNVNVIERTFKNILMNFENQKKLTSQASVVPVSMFSHKPTEEGAEKNQQIVKPEF